MLGNQYINYGAFLTAVINFIIMAFVILVIMKVINKLASDVYKRQVSIRHLLPVRDSKVIGFIN